MPDDATLLRRYAETRAEDAFAELVRRHIDGVYSAALRRVGGDRHLAEDVAQQVFVALARKAEALSRRPALTSWLYTATRHEAANVVRTERRRKAREREAQAMQETLSEVESARDWSRVAPVLDDAMDELNETDRTAVLLRFVDRCAFADIGATLRVSEDAARMRVERALDKLRILLARRGVVSTSTALAVTLGNHAVAAAPAALATSVTTTVQAAGGTWAGASVGAGTVMELWGFMTTTKWIASLAGALAIVAAVGTATHRLTSKIAAARELGAAERKYAARAVALESATRHAESAAQAKAQSEQRLAAARAEQATRAAEPPVVAPAPAPAWDPVAKGHEFMQRHPEVRAALSGYVRANLNFRYGPLFRELRLTPAQIEEFIQIWGNSIGMGAGTADGDVSLRLREGLSTVGGLRPARSLTERTRELLGEEGMRWFNAFNDTRPGRELAAEVASSLYFTEAPLTPQQAEKLIPIVAESRRRVPGSSRTERDWDTLLSRAAGVLSPPQMEVLAGRRAGEQFHAVLNRPRSEGARVAPEQGGGE